MRTPVDDLQEGSRGKPAGADHSQPPCFRNGRAQLWCGDTRHGCALHGQAAIHELSKESGKRTGHPCLLLNWLLAKTDARTDRSWYRARTR